MVDSDKEKEKENTETDKKKGGGEGLNGTTRGGELNVITHRAENER